MTYVERAYDDGPRIAWGAVIAGALVAVAVGAMLNLLGVAMGAAALDPYDMSRGDAKGLAVAGGIWLAFANAVGLFIGAWLAARVGGGWDLRTAGLRSLSVWAVAFAMALVIAGFTGTGFIGTLIRGASENPGAAMAVAESTVDASTRAPGELPGVVTPVEAAQAVENTADAAGAVAGWAFLTMLLGLLGALLGGWLAARDKDVHVRTAPTAARDDVTYTKV